MALAVIISQPFNIRPAKTSFRNIFRPFNNASKDKNEETTFERYLWTFSKKEICPICLHYLVILYSAVVIQLSFTSTQHILNLIGSSVFPLV